MAGDHNAGRRTEPRASRVGQLLQCWLIIPSLSRPRSLHSGVVAPVAAVQTQGQATPRRDLSTLAPLRVLRARTSDPSWARPVVGEGVRACPRAVCGRPECPVRGAGRGDGATVEPLRHRQTKGAETDMPGLPPPRHVPTLPYPAHLRPAGGGSGQHPKAGARSRETLSREETSLRSGGSRLCL